MVNKATRAKSPDRLNNLLNEDTWELQTLRNMNNEMIKVVYIQDEDTVQVNIIILVTCFTTCWARLKLYQEGLS